MSNDGTPAKVRLTDGLGPLVEAAEKYAANYNDDDRQDIRCDVLNAWHAGAKFAQAAERERYDELFAAYNEACAISSRRAAAVDSIVGHWREFGPEHGLDEVIESAAAVVGRA